ERVAKLTGFFHGLLCPPGHGRLFKKMIEQFRKRVRLPAQSGIKDSLIRLVHMPAYLRLFLPKKFQDRNSKF
ncbi:hypothetical protein, partial [Desulfobacter postgatei]|uniref:hypothetical protein n=1 Tax=Desulfobacter postgatei TaxID=2293 RepID=UPI002A368780